MADLKIVSRKEWGAAAPTKSMYSVPLSEREYFFVHYLGKEQSREDAVAQLKGVQKYHQKANGWADIGYNFAIDNNTGTIYEARGKNKVGAHCPGHNRNGIGVLVMLGVDEEVSDVARRALADLRYVLELERGGKKLIAKGHRDGKATACPGDNLQAFVETDLDISDLVAKKQAEKKAAPAPVSDKPSAHAMDEDHSDCDHVKHAPPSAPVLRRGDKGPWVRTLQRALRIGEDGDFGPNTQRAVGAFQRARGLTVDGVVGPQTWKALGVTA